MHRVMWLPGVIVVLAAALLIMTNDFDGLYGQDAYAYYDYAVTDLRDQLYPPPPFFWPPGYPMLVMLASLIFGANPIAGQIVSLIGGALVAVFTGLIAYELTPHPPAHSPLRIEGENHSQPFSKSPLQVLGRGFRGGVMEDRIIAALAAGLAMSVVGQLWQSSVVVMADTTALAGATIGMWALIKYRSTSLLPYLMLASGAVAYAVITRWAYAVVAIVCVAQVLMIWYQVARENRNIGTWRAMSLPIRHAILGGIPALIVLLPVLIPVITSGSGTESTFGGNFSYQFVRWDIANAFRREFENPDGFQNYTLYNGIYYALLPVREFYFAPVLAAFGVFGLIDIVRRRQLIPYAPVLGWGLAFYILLIGGPQQNVRFGLSTMPPVAVLIGAGFVSVQHWLADLTNRFREIVGARHASPVLHQLRVFQIGIVIAFFIGLGWAALAGINYTNDFISRKNVDLRIVRWAARQIPPDAQVIAFGVTLTMQHYTDLETYEIYYLTRDDLPALLDTEQPTYLLLDPYIIETQWIGRSPSNNFRWLRDSPGLTRIGQNRNYLLYRVDP